MKTSKFEKGISMLQRASALAGMLFAVLPLAAAGCTGGFFNDNLSEGDRCNPASSHNECGSGLVCTGQGSSPAIAFCPENYCCPVDSNGNITSSNVFCQPGCNGGAAALCSATMDPGACALANGTAPPMPDAGSAETGGE
jgi:hypothetical protein